MADRDKLKEKMISSRAKFHEKFEEDKVKIFGELLKVIPREGLETMSQRREWAEINAPRTLDACGTSSRSF